MKTSRKTSTAGVFGGTPSYFRAFCYEARAGGSAGYDVPGFQLSRHVANDVPYDVGSYDEWESVVDELRDAAARGDDDAVLSWFLAHYPWCMELVPPRRQEQFLRGVYRARERELI